MREDPTKSGSFLHSQIWGRQKYNEDFLVSPEQFDFEKDDPRNQRKFVSNSLSGRERNRLFMKAQDDFKDISLVSGTDDHADARSFALLDFNNDGWMDIALMSLNAPRFKLFRNELGETCRDRSFARIRLVGGQQSAQPVQGLSNRDGIGARILITMESGRRTMFQKQAGEGFGSQNSSTLHVGSPRSDIISRIDVRWPSGRQQSIDSPDTSQVIVIREVSE